MNSARRSPGPLARFRFLAVGILCFTLLATAAGAADAAKPEDLGRYQVVPGGEDKAYLVDTVTGAVWILTYRTTATGREPVAFPYIFIRKTPKNQGEFLVENPGPNSAVPYGITKDK